MPPKRPAKPRIGRPPRYDAVGPVDFHLGLRFDRLCAAQLQVIAALENENAKRAGKKPNVTPSSLASAWIRERLDAEIRQRGLVTRAARRARRTLDDDARKVRASKKLTRALWNAQVGELRGRDKRRQSR
jgi:hypothetical protein